MLKSTLALYNNIHIETYSSLITYLKRKGDHYMPEKSEILTRAQIEKFLNIVS